MKYGKNRSYRLHRQLQIINFFLFQNQKCVIYLAKPCLLQTEILTSLCYKPSKLSVKSRSSGKSTIRDTYVVHLLLKIHHVHLLAACPYLSLHHNFRKCKSPPKKGTLNNKFQFENFSMKHNCSQRLPRCNFFVSIPTYISKTTPIFLRLHDWHILELGCFCT